MRLPPRLRLHPSARRELAAVAGGLEPAELALTGARVLNVFTGSVAPASIGIHAGRIAWVGEPPAPALREVDAGGRVVVPGLIDPHCHADILMTPSAFAHAAAAAGTTAAVVDTNLLTNHLDDAALERVMDVLEGMPMKFLWGIRPSRDGGDAGDEAALPPERLRRLVARPGVAGAGEITAWRALLDGDPRLQEFVAAVADAGLNVDAHAPGASPRTLTRLAAAGLTSDHEAITGEELAARVELGLWTMVRHSSLRRDGPELGRAIVERGLPADRLMLTADGIIPQDLVDGHLDTVVRKVVEGGVAPIDAIRMATLHPATYLGVDAHVGAVAPGRCADLVLVDDIEEFRPRRVMCDGRFVEPAADATAGIEWGSMTVDIREGPVTAQAIVAACRSAPAIRMGGVIARLDERPGPQPTYVALVARDGSAIAGTTTADLDVQGVASTVTARTDVLLLGSEPEAMAAAYREVVRAGGGLAAPGLTVPLPTFGHLGAGSVPELASALAEFERVARLPQEPPPFTYRTLFLTLPALPGICLTTDGLLDVKARRRLTEATALA